MENKCGWEEYLERFGNPKQNVENIALISKRLQEDTYECVEAMTEKINNETFWANMAANLAPKIDTSLGDIESVRKEVARVAEIIEREFGIVVDQEASIKRYEKAKLREWREPVPSKLETEKTFMRKKCRAHGIAKETNKLGCESYQRMMAKKKAKNRKKRRK